MKKLSLLLLSASLMTGGLRAQTAIQFVNPIPSSFDGASQIPQFADICPDMTLPSGHVYFKPPTKKGWTTQKIMAKGVTHWAPHYVGEDGGADTFRNNPLYAKREYNNVPQIRHIFGLPGPVNGNWWPNGFYNEDQARQKGREVPINARMWVGETMEGEDYVPEDHPMWGWFYDELIKRYDDQKAQDGAQYYVAHNYFTRFPSAYQVGHDTRANHEALYNTTWQNWPVTKFHPGQSLGRTNTVLEGIYVNVPDLVTQQLLGAIMRMELMQKMGKFTGLFQFNVHEWHPGFASKIKYSDGSFYRSDKAPLDPNIQIALAFLAHEYGTIFIEWGLNVRASDTKKPVDFYPSIHIGKDFWFPNGQTEPSSFPYYSENGPNRYGPNAYLGDITHFGVALWNATGSQVAGGTSYYATYKLDGGNWINRQANGSDIVASYFEKRGLCKVRILGNKMLICYFNFFADNEPHAIEVQHPTNSSLRYTGTVCGNGVHAVVVSF